MPSATAKIFMDGRDQAVRLPAEFRFDGEEVFIEKQGELVILRPKPKNWDDFFDDDSLQATPDFMADRQDLAFEERDLF